jgi:beta-galactosidase
MLNDVFGLRTSAFYEVQHPLKFELDGRTVDTGVLEYEALEPSTANVIARFLNDANHAPAITLNKFGKGRAIYLATQSKASAIGPVLISLFRQAGIQPGPKTPGGVYARVVDGRTLYVNTTRQEQLIPIDGMKKGVVTGRSYRGEVVLGPWQADLIQ